jgi:ABC-type Mn2+/Zn2+ transport system ATPase subunit
MRSGISSQLLAANNSVFFLARALVARPQLLLLDEPNTGVDLKTQHDILHLLHELNREGMTIPPGNATSIPLPAMSRGICFQHGVIAQGPPETVFTPGILPPDVQRRHGGAAPGRHDVYC